jgi:hypothetical protein
VSDITLPDVEILTDLDRSVVAVLAPTVIEEVVEVAAEEAILEPEVIGRGKEAEGEEEETGRSRREEERE